MKRSLDNQINTFLIDISWIKWLFFLLRSSSAQLDRWQASKQWPSIDQRPIEQTAYLREVKDNGYKSVFTNSWLVHQRNRPWIKGWGKNPQKSELVYSWQCLLFGATEPWPHGLWETLACIHVSQPNGTSWVTCWQGSRLKHTKIGMRV